MEVGAVQLIHSCFFFCFCFIEALLDETKLAYSLHKDILNEIEVITSRKRRTPAAPTSMPLSQPPDTSPKTFSVTSVLTFMFAVGLAHFLIVVGGLSGSRGYSKLEAIQAWISNTVPSD